MNAWGAFCNVQFTETAANPQVRIARTGGDGYWSYLGTDVLHIAAGQPTMNLDSFTMNTADSEFHRVIRHETGHTLGFPHEHLRKEIVNRIDRAKALQHFESTQGWSEAMVIAQVLTPLDDSALVKTAQADIHSIMCYWLPATIMTDNVAVDGGTDIDALDAQFSSGVYPQLTRSRTGRSWTTTPPPSTSSPPAATSTNATTPAGSGSTPAHPTPAGKNSTTTPPPSRSPPTATPSTNATTPAGSGSMPGDAAGDGGTPLTPPLHSVYPTRPSPDRVANPRGVHFLAWR